MRIIQKIKGLIRKKTRASQPLAVEEKELPVISPIIPVSQEMPVLCTGRPFIEMLHRVYQHTELQAGMNRQEVSDREMIQKMDLWLVRTWKRKSHVFEKQLEEQMVHSDRLAEAVGTYLLGNSFGGQSRWKEALFRELEQKQRREKEADRKQLDIRIEELTTRTVMQQKQIDVLTEEFRSMKNGTRRQEEMKKIYDGMEAHIEDRLWLERFRQGR